MNQATKEYNVLIDQRCSTSSLARITRSHYFLNNIANFNGSFTSYLKSHYGLSVMTYNQYLQKSKQIDYKANESELNNVCIVNEDWDSRFMTERDVEIMKIIVRKYYLDSGEINLRIALLLNTKVGTKFLSKVTNSNPKLISRARHDNGCIYKISYSDRINLENYYLNSEFVVHLRNFRVNF